MISLFPFESKIDLQLVYKGDDFLKVAKESEVMISS